MDNGSYLCSPRAIGLCSGECSNLSANLSIRDLAAELIQGLLGHHGT